MNIKNLFILMLLVYGTSTITVYAQTATITNASIQSIDPQPITITKELKIGSSGDDVKTLQRIISVLPEVYPEKLITGFFGPITKKAVERFQIYYKLVVSGEVKGDTLKKLNELSRASLAGPVISNLISEPVNGYSSMISWKTEGLATSEIIYGSSPLNRTEGKLTVKDSRFIYQHVIELTHLFPSTQYYFMVISRDGETGRTSTMTGQFTTQGI